MHGGAQESRDCVIPHELLAVRAVCWRLEEVRNELMPVDLENLRLAHATLTAKLDCRRWLESGVPHSCSKRDSGQHFFPLPTLLFKNRCIWRNILFYYPKNGQLLRFLRRPSR
jgi:hypothetical protein